MGSISENTDGRSYSRCRFSGTGTVPASGSTISRNLGRVRGGHDHPVMRKLLCFRQQCMDFRRRCRVRAPDLAIGRMIAADTRLDASSEMDQALICCPSAAASGYRFSRRSRLLGLPTSMAEASVATLARGCSTPVLRNSGTVALALCASTMRSIGKPMRRAHRQAAALPRLPLGMMYDALSPVCARSARLLVRSTQPGAAGARG